MAAHSRRASRSRDAILFPGDQLIAQILTPARNRDRIVHQFAALSESFVA